MEEINLYHLVREHPLISFLIFAVPIVLLTSFSLSKYLSYRENRRDKEQKERKGK